MNQLKKLRALVQLIPAVLVAAVVLATLPYTGPVLADIPARLSAEAAAPASSEAEEEEPALPLLPYEDGVYTGSSRGFGGPVKVQVTMEGGYITDIQILSAKNETSAFLKRAKRLLTIVKQSQTWEVDAVSEATYTSRGILGAIQNALTGEVVINPLPPQQTKGNAEPPVMEEFTPPSAYRDGVYTASAEGFGGPITVQVTVANDVITDITVLSHEGETASYFTRARRVISAILETGTPVGVDSVSGATYSSTGLLNAVKAALTKAAVNSDETTPPEEEPAEELPEDTEEPAAPALYRDGVYTASAQGFGGPITVQITVANDHITDITVLSHEGETLSYFSRARRVISAILETGTPVGVDAISGATYSSTGLLDAVKAALAKAAFPDETTPPEEETPETPAQPEEPAAPQYPDGVYTGSSSTVRVSVTVAGGSVTDVQVLPEEPATPSFLEQIRNALLAFFTGQSQEPAAPAYTAEELEEAVQDALQQALAAMPEEPAASSQPEPETPAEQPAAQPEPQPADSATASAPAAPQYTDGTYTAVAVCEEGDDFCYDVRVTVTIAGGAVTDVQVIRENDTSESPADNRRYLDRARNGRTDGSATGLIVQILQAQSADALDAVSGATYSSQAIQSAARQALAQAAGGSKE